MTGTRVSVLTPPGAGAIATVAVAGPRAWATTRQLFRPAGKKSLPEIPDRHRFWFGTFGEGTGDEVVLSVTQIDPEMGVEVHCHGGRRVVRWVVEQFTARGCVEPKLGEPMPPARLAIDFLSRAPTLRTASILLDQYHGAFDRSVRAILTHLDAGRTSGAARELATLTGFAGVGRHLVDPWKVVIAGPPNVGKSSLVNALTGYQRSVVSDIAGTTRDVVTVPAAFDGWPVELADTAGLREAAGLEGEGVERAKRFLAAADLCVWVLDATAADPEGPGANAPSTPRTLFVVNKVDQPAGWDLSRSPDALRVSAATGEGIPGLAAAIARSLVPIAPSVGDAVPFTRRLADLVECARAVLSAGRPADAGQLLRDGTPGT
ncbi:MAG: GTPase and tRNA-U34 5-formylation enzyme TrmE [Gemmataceae bacterium]|nr:GTPase and tRNA-U34 5-formylation enzyme TrmE [Gemmataceae bacterium]